MHYQLVAVYWPRKPPNRVAKAADAGDAFAKITDRQVGLITFQRAKADFSTSLRNP
jgi:hypothetical protein